MDIKILNNIFKDKFLISIINILFLIQSLLRIYKSNDLFFFETIYNSTNTIFILSIIILIYFIRNNKLYFIVSFFLILDFPFILKQNIQNYISNEFQILTLFQNHLLTLLILSIILITIFFINYKYNLKIFIYFFIIFYIVNILFILSTQKKTLPTKIFLEYKIKNISNNCYVFLFDEYPNDEIAKKYTSLKEEDLPSNFLKQKNFKTDLGIFSNYINTEMSTTAILTGINQEPYNINKTIYALEENVFSKNNSYDFNCISIFDDTNRPNSLVSVEFFDGLQSLSTRYIIPFILQFIIKKGVGVFTNYDVYHKNSIEKLIQFSKNRKKHVTYIHFYTPHNYPKVENSSIEERILNANSWMKKSIDIIEQYDKSSSIILLSDHGLRNNNIPKDKWNKNILYYKNIEIDTVTLNKKGINYLFENTFF